MAFEAAVNQYPLIVPLNLHLSNLTPSEHQSSVAVDITNRNVAEQMETQSI